ncbi:MAG: hypothetical protein AAFV45_04820, partial [Pseudomonadota bacterium]
AAPPDVGQEARKQEGPARGAFLLEMPTLTVAYSYSGALAYILSGVDMSGRYPENLTAAKLLALSKDLPRDWKQQHKILGF